jgi:hypothetical protein
MIAYLHLVNWKLLKLWHLAVHTVESSVAVIFYVLDPGILVSKDVLDTGISEITDDCDAEISVSVDVIASCKFEPSATEL